jgi:arylsulfatase
MEVYAAQVEAMDRGIGKIIEAIESTGRLNNTIIIFLADNGGCAEELGTGNNDWLKKLIGTTKTRNGRLIEIGNNPSIMPGGEATFQSVGLQWANAQNTPFRLFKHYIHEGGISTPLIVQWPDKIKKHGELIHESGMLMDIMATCISVSGAQYPHRFKGMEIKPLEGFDLMPLILQGKKSKREIMCWEHENNKAIRQGNWKLVSRQEKKKWELYDIENDRIESNDLSEKYPDIVKDMSLKWEAWALKSNVLWKKAGNQ